MQETPPPPDPIEVELVRRAKQGDQIAWEELVRSYQEQVFRIGYLILADAVSAEDVAQETFLRAYQNLDRFDDTRPLRPWLLQIAANQARNKRRSIGRYWNAIQKAIRDAETIESTYHPAESDRFGEYQDLWSAIRTLEPADQQIIYLRFFLELPVSETALTLNIAEGTVKSRLSRALEKLRETIGREFPTLLELKTGSS